RGPPAPGDGMRRVLRAWRVRHRGDPHDPHRRPAARLETETARRRARGVGRRRAGRSPRRPLGGSPRRDLRCRDPGARRERYGRGPPSRHHGLPGTSRPGAGPAPRRCGSRGGARDRFQPRIITDGRAAAGHGARRLSARAAPCRSGERGHSQRGGGARPRGGSGPDRVGDPNPHLAVFNRIGDLYLKVREPAQAADYYDQAVDKYAELGVHNNAIAMCNKVLRNAPGRQTTYLKLAKLYASKGFMAEAKQNFVEYAERMHKVGKIQHAFAALKELADISAESAHLRETLEEHLRMYGAPE